MSWITVVAKQCGGIRAGGTARSKDDNAAFTREVGHPLTFAIKACAEDDYRTTVELIRSVREIARRFLQDTPEAELPDSFPKVVDALRVEGLLPAVSSSYRSAFDITREPLVFPVPRSAALATMARAETGSLLAIAYSNMRGYGDVHPIIAELRVGYLPVMLPHPVGGEPVEAGEVLMTDCEVVAMYEGAAPLVARGADRREAHDQARELLTLLNLPERLWGVPPATFSGGEKQRVNLARGLIAWPRLLLLDEPTASLDPATTEQVVELLKRIKAKGVAMLAIFHQPELVRRFADRVVKLASSATAVELLKHCAL